MPKLAIRQLPLGPIGTNCYIVSADGSSRAFVIDPGDDAPRVLDVVASEGLQVEAVLVTHCHWDHIGAVAPVVRQTGATVYMSGLEAFVLEQEPNRFVPPGVGPFEPCEVQVKLSGGEMLEIAGVQLEVLHLPGHSPGTMGFFADGELDDDGGWKSPPILFVGDLIFQGSVGRVDLPGADAQALLDSARMLFERMDDATVLLSGHGAPTTIAQERRTNPFLQDLAAR